MAQSLEEFIEASRKARSLDELKKLYHEAIIREGYENLVFATGRNNRLEHITWADFPDGYVSAYRDHHWDGIDPILHHAHQARTPFAWNRIIARTKVTRKQSNFLRDCREIGVHSGLTIPIHGPGNRVDVFSLSLRHEREAPAHRIPYLHALTVQTWLRQTELSPIPPVIAGIPRLTRRQIECLKWAKDGKTTEEIATIMSIAARTVEFHLHNAAQKLGADNRVMAIVIALQTGLIS